MLDKLIESKNNRQENKKIRSLLLTTSTIIFSGVIFALVFSLFSQNLALGQDNINLTTLLAPTIIPEDKPEPPAPNKKVKKIQQKNSPTNVPTRTKVIMRVDETPTKMPTAISTTPSKEKARPIGEFKIGLKDVDPVSASDFQSEKPSSGGIGKSFDLSDTSSTVKKEEPTIKKDVPKPPPPPEKKVEKQETRIVSGGVINGKALNLVKPSYPAAAKAMQLRGQVTIQVMIDEAGKVISAQPVKGHQLFHTTALNAARQSIFSPTTLSGNKVKVRGLIVYNFN